MTRSELKQQEIELYLMLQNMKPIEMKKDQETESEKNDWTETVRRKCEEGDPRY